MVMGSTEKFAPKYYKNQKSHPKLDIAADVLGVHPLPRKVRPLEHHVEHRNHRQQRNDENERHGDVAEGVDEDAGDRGAEAEAHCGEAGENGVERRADS